MKDNTWSSFPIVVKQALDNATKSSDRSAPGLHGEAEAEARSTIATVCGFMIQPHPSLDNLELKVDEFNFVFGRHFRACENAVTKHLEVDVNNRNKRYQYSHLTA